MYCHNDHTHSILLLFLSLATVPICLVNGTKISSNVIELNERFLDVMDHGFWFVEFYAPWCAHCKKLMPVWEHMAHALADSHSPIRVAKLDCTRFSSVSSALRIHGFPTIIFFRNGIQIPYEGERRKEELVRFAEKCAGPVVASIDKQEKFQELRKSSDREPFFVFYDPVQRATDETTNEHILWRQFSNVSETYFTEVNFYKITDKHVLPGNERPTGNGTVILIFKDFDYLASFDEKDDLLRWIGRQRWPLLPIVTASNIHTISELSGKMLVLGTIEGVDRHNLSTESGRFFDMFKRTASEARNNADVDEQFQFGWLDGNQIANGIVMGNFPVPSFLVFNLSSYEFYISDDHPPQMTSQALLLFLQNVLQGNVKAQGGRAWITRLRRMAYEITSNIYDMFQHQPILTVCLFGVPLAFFSIITYSICSTDFFVERDEIYPTDDEEEDLIDEDDFTHVRPEALDEIPSETAHGHEKAE